MSDNKVTLDQLDNSAVEAMSSSVGDVNMLNTENKTIVGAISEIVGKKEIANAIGEPLAETDKFTEMSSEINGLLSTFKTNMMNAGVVVESGDKFKQLIDKIKGLSGGEGNKGILYTKTNFTISDTPITFETYSSNYENNQNYQQFLPATVSLDFNPTVYIVNFTSKKQFENGNCRLYEEFHIYDTTEPYEGAIWDYCHVSYGDFTSDGKIIRESSWSWNEYIKNNVENNMITFPIISSYEFSDGSLTTFDEVLYSVFYAIGVGEEDTTLRDSLASILQDEGVNLTEEDDMASLITKTDNEFAENTNKLYEIMLAGGYEVNSGMNMDNLLDLLELSGISVSDIEQIACGFYHTFILKNNGSLWACGNNEYGQLGLGNSTTKKSFTQVTTNISNIKQIVCGHEYAFILKNDGSVWACGSGGDGQLGLNNTINKTTFTQVTENVNNDVKQIACGYNHTFILKNDGTVWSCGYNSDGQLGLGTNGYNTNKTTFTQVTENISNDVKEIACGNYHTFILKNDGSVWACGLNDNGQLGLNDTTDRKTFTKVTENVNNDVKQIVCSDYFTFILKNDGTVWCCGENDKGQLGLGNTTDKLTFTQVNTNTINNVKEIACGANHTVILKNDGTVWGCGYNSNGHLGLGDDTEATADKLTFTKVTTNINKDVKEIACGNYHTFILKNDGSVWSCGANKYGQLGLGTSDSKYIFTMIPRGLY